MTKDEAVVQAEGASRQARLRRHRGQCQRRIWPQPDRRKQPADQGGAGDAWRTPSIPTTLSARSAGSWPGVVFTGPPLHLPAGQFGGGRGGGAHAPDEWLLIESSNPKVLGFDGQAILYADFLYEVARTRRNQSASLAAASAQSSVGRGLPSRQRFSRRALPCQPFPPPCGFRGRAFRRLPTGWWWPRQRPWTTTLTGRVTTSTAASATLATTQPDRRSE